MWPALSRALTDFFLPDLLLAIAGSITWAALAWSAVRWLAREAPLQSISPRRPMLHWTSRRPLPVVRLELIRLLRTGWVRASWLGALAIALAGAGSVAVLPGSSRETAAGLAAILVGISLAQVPLLARGVSPRDRPPQLLLGIGAARWAMSVIGAAAALFAAIGLPTVIALAVPMEPRLATAFGLGVYLPLLAGAIVLGAWLMPGRDSAGVNVGALWLLMIVSFGVVQGVDEWIADEVAAGAALAACSLALLGLPVAAERWRWRRYLGFATPRWIPIGGRPW